VSVSVISDPQTRGKTKTEEGLGEHTTVAVTVAESALDSIKQNHKDDIALTAAADFGCPIIKAPPPEKVSPYDNLLTKIHPARRPPGWDDFYR